MAVEATAGSSPASSAGDKDFDSWFDTTKAKVMDLNMSDDDFIKFVSKEFSSSKSSEAKKTALQQLIALRSEAVESISNALRVILEASRVVINNIRP